MNEAHGNQRGEIAASLDRWRMEFHDLVDQIGPDDWERASGNAGWNVRQVVGHLALQPAACAQVVGLARAGKGLLNRAPLRLLDLGNLWRVRATTRGLTPAAARVLFDTGHRCLRDLLDDVRDDEFESASMVIRSRVTVADAFRELGRQIADHGPQALAGVASTIGQSAAVE
jgi:hypothetical protein